MRPNKDLERFRDSVKFGNALDKQSLVLEVGSGPGDLWVHNLDHCEPGWVVILSDFSEGMMKQA